MTVEIGCSYFLKLATDRYHNNAFSVSVCLSVCMWLIPATLTNHRLKLGLSYITKATVTPRFRVSTTNFTLFSGII